MAIEQRLMQQRYGTTTEWTSANPTLLAGEIGVDITTKRFRIGDGTSSWSALEEYRSYVAPTTPTISHTALTDKNNAGQHNTTAITDVNNGFALDTTLDLINVALFTTLPTNITAAQNTADTALSRIKAAQGATVVGGGSLTTNASNGTDFTYDLTSNSVLNAPTSPTNRQSILWEFRQGGTAPPSWGGPWSLTFNAIFVWPPEVTEDWEISPEYGSTSYMKARYSGLSSKWHVLAYGKGWA